ncbi:hypothetical protein LTR84_002812 [Exophiala bonariae]|uniref:Nucleoside phosphorylase domain-containing protein n=1 Tax=Exophiala bonariae TaxID=1690606 RepID=A0AAV9NDE8_9EURO|nr:hypothetical protein LTR84_002812 [Exophiala bonariae]
MSLFEIAIICALCEGYDAVKAILDEVYDGDIHRKGQNDPKNYTLGKISALNVVLSLLPRMGKKHAASGSAYFRTSFPDIKLCFLVGICAEAPRNKRNEELLLGDVIVSTELVQSDFGRQWKDGISRKDTIGDNLGRPNKEIRVFLAELQTWETGKKLRADAVASFVKMLQIRDVWQNPGREHDIMFDPDYEHKHQVEGECHVCSPDETCDLARGASCKDVKCDTVKILVRGSDREDEHLLIHFGAFSSADQVIKSSKHRNAVTAADGAIAFEMQGAGVWDNFPTIIVKCVCDYADSHKNKKF